MKILRQNHYQIIIVGILILLIIYLSPVIFQFNGDNFIRFIKSDNGFSLAFIRSILFGISTSLICVFIGLWLAFKIIGLDIFCSSGKFLAILITPFLIGSTSVAFVFKILLLNTHLMKWAYISPLNLFLILSIIQLWQFGSLFTYLFWLSLKSINTRYNQYALVFKMTKWEYFKDICLPHLRNLIILLFFICFIFSFYEDVKISLIFKVSEGLNSELISHWIYRNYQSDILLDYNYAIQKVAQVSHYTLTIIIFCFASIGLSFAFIIEKLKKGKIIFKSKKLLYNKTIEHNRYFVIISIIILLPLLFVFCINGINLSKINFLFLPILLSAIGALLSTFFAIIFSFLSRVMNIEKMSSFNLFSYSFLLGLYLILLIPPIEIMLAGFKWMNLLSISGLNSTVLFWLIGHSFLSLPILGSFLIVTNFQITTNELNYCKIFNVSMSDIFNFNFMKRLLSEYLLTFLFAYTIILNEGLLNKVFSDRIPSFVSALNDSISSKNADYSVSMLFFLISILIAFLCVSVWVVALKKYHNEEYFN